MKTNNKRKVFVGMSGGVDSSVSAAILKRDGHDVFGVFIKVWSPDWLPCTWREERRDTMRVAACLKIPLITLDLEKEYKKDVADYMVREYRNGRIPNPDVMCNKVIKFGGFFDFAMRNGADFVATGHYATTSCSVGEESAVTFPAHGKRGKFATKITADSSPRGATVLMASEDKEKDQTYFLWTLTQRELSKTLFPIGNLQKSEVRKLAKKFNLPNADKKDSQGLCFLGHVDMMEFLKHYIKQKTGKVLNTGGVAIGSHDGAAYYTIGQRHGFNTNNKTPEDLPWYVASKDIKKNILVVSHEKVIAGLKSKEVVISKVNWCGGVEPNLSKKYSARWRYRQPLYGIKIEKLRKKGLYKIVFDKDQESIAQGQSVVMYDEETCLGGGIIV
ncbi:MAG: tRNA 2-thiouridine(34) synthase MnmA [Candidatus Vogelbacteria bacterium]|nr:tRNA 2-thiouridine(34) synthase MnmA [Candidatus Vogelbacteria bacterium]